MHSATPSVATGDTSGILAARIDAQDKPTVLPLREYLETHGVTVFVNMPATHPATYHIVMGDNEFVKHIFSRAGKIGEHTLALVVGYPFVLPVSPSHRGKTIYLDPKEISRDRVTDIFEFFFTSEKNVLDLRTTRLTRSAHENSAANPPGPTPAGDQERISHIIRDVFGEKVRPTPHRRKKRKQWAIGLLMGVGIIILPFLWYLFSITIAGAALAASAQSLVAGNAGAAGWQTRVAGYWIGQGSIIIHAAAAPLRWAGVEDTVRGQERLLSFFADSADASKNMQSMIGVGQSVASGFLNQVDVTSTGTTPVADITKLRTALDSVQNILGLAQSELFLLLRDRTFPFTVPAVARVGTRTMSEISTLRNFSSDMDHLVSLFLQLSGFAEPRKYLILLQNSAELRATGGFIGSVAVTTFEDGRMTDLAVSDVYTFDGQLKGHVDPPLPVRELLGQEHWYLRDSNWDPDFSVSAERAAWFYQKESGSSVDGVFAVNTPFIIEVLKATGPVDLPDYNDRITADNFYGKSLYYTHNDFFPGSTQKKDFLGTLTRALITKITTSRTTNMPALFRAVTTSLAGHDLLMMVPHPELESVVSHYGWAGRVPSAEGCAGVSPASCGFDPLIMVEANMGINKANYFIERSVDREVTVNADGTIGENATVTIKNTSGKDQGMPYRVYLRFLLPIDVSVSAVRVDGTKLNTRKDTAKTPVLPYLERTDTTSRFYVLGVAVDIPADSQKQVAVTYTRETTVSFGESGAVVDLFVQKQPGVSRTPVHTIIRYPAAWTAGMEGQEDFIAMSGQLEYNTVLDRDRLTRIRFTK